VDDEADGVRGRPSYVGEAYGFHTDVLHIRMPAMERLMRQMGVVAEFSRCEMAKPFMRLKDVKLL
jgi:hypothetical protein